MANATPLAGTASYDTQRWLLANSTNTTALAPRAVLTSQADFEALEGALQNSAREPGMEKFGVRGQQLTDPYFNVKVAHGLLLVNFCLVGVDDVTATFKITGYQKGKLPSTATYAQNTRMVPTPLVAGTLTRGTKATASGVTDEGYADTIVVADTSKFTAVQTFSADVQTGLANDVATLLISTLGYEWFLLEFDRDAGGGTAATSCNAEFRFM